MYDPNQKSRSSTKMWPCTHVWPKPKIKIKNKNVTLYTCMTLTKNQGQVQKCDLVHLYDPNPKSRSSTTIWPCTHVWHKPKIKVKNQNVTLYTCMTLTKNQGQVQKCDLVHMHDPNQKSRSSTNIWPCTHVWP